MTEKELLKAELQDTRETIYNLRKRIEDWKREFRRYGTHESYCAILEMGECGRVLPVECTCCFKDMLAFAQPSKEK